MSKRSRARLLLSPLEDRWTPATAGSLDPTFGTNGVAALNLPSLNSRIISPATAATGSDGRVVVFGTLESTNTAGYADRVIARFTADGRLDTTFGTDGVYTLRNVPQPPGRVAVDAAGRVLYTFAASALTVGRLTADGFPDTSFGTNGGAGPVTVSGVSGTAPAIAVQPDGRILVAGGSNEAIAVERYTTDGRPDPTFGTNGEFRLVVPASGSSGAYAEAVTVQPDGRIELAGAVTSVMGARIYTYLTYDPLVMRLTPAGQLDPTFGTNGIVRLDTPQQYDAATSLQTLPDGRTVVASLGTAYRLTANGGTDTSYGSNGQATLAGSSPVVLADGRVVAGETVAASGSTAGSTIFRRLTADGQPDTSLPSSPLPVTAGLLVGRPDGGVVGLDSSAGLTAFRVLGADTAFPTAPGTVSTGGPANGAVTPLAPAAGGSLQPGASIIAYPDFAGSVRTATADVTGDGVPDVITGPGPGGGPNVTVIDGKTGLKVANLDVFEATFTGGVYVAAADLNGDGKAEVVVTPDEGGGPVVAIYDGAKLTAGQNNDAQRTRFYGIVDPNFRGGARAAVADVSGDGTPDLLVAAGFGGGPRLAVFDGRAVLDSSQYVAEVTGITVLTTPAGAFHGHTDQVVSVPRKLVPDFFVFEDTLRNGVFVAGGDLTGDGAAEVIVGGGPGGGPRVLALDGRALVGGQQAPVANFFAGDASSRGGVRVAVTPDATGAPQLVTGSGDGEAARVRVYKPATARAGATPDQELTPFGGAVLGNGVFVG